MTTPDEYEQIIASAIIDMAIYDSLTAKVRNLLANGPHDWALASIPPSHLRGGSKRLRKALDHQLKLMDPPK